MFFINIGELSGGKCQGKYPRPVKLVTNWKCQNTIRTLTLSIQPLDLNPVENLYRMVALEIVNSHPSIRHELSESLIVACKS